MTTLKEGSQVFINFYQSGIAGNGTVVNATEIDGKVFYDIDIFILTPERTQESTIDYDSLHSIGYKIKLNNIPAFLVTEVVYDAGLVNPDHVDAMAIDDETIQDAVVVEDTPEDAILNAMKQIVIDNETKNKAETETLKVNREVDAE